ncbi:hypothetical protein [Tessaracoccus rhinocerotis]|uniref:hypothetical protein n=1 Tax=Tessaracoccus rhinocerotis TaxID=1689449 RepID=UPI00117DA379|nr:hypothetical protein [Tessaracoccus rhinocerotis]
MSDRGVTPRNADVTRSCSNPNSPFAFYKVVDKSKTLNYVNRGQVLASCKALNTGVTCSISKGASSTRTVQLGMTMKRAEITGSLGISSAATVSVNVTCTSPTMYSGQVFKAFPMGERHRYKVQRESLLGIEKTGWLYAFNPTVNGFACGF